ncbi:MAG: hypothetical protein ACN2B6_04655 [Rickettsiales bacterium]
MSFKAHLLVIAAIVIVISLIWQASQTPSDKQVVTIDNNPYKISIVHASWGLNCIQRYRTPPKTLRDDNVIEAVTSLCDGKSECTIPVNTETLGKDPAIRCSDKLLKVEYRCFSYDRIREISAISRKLQIECNESVVKEEQ